MAKKGLLVLILAATFAAGSAFAQVQLSAGLGGNFAVHFSRMTLDVPWASVDPIDSTAMGGGFFGFFDATYAEASVGMGFANSKQQENTLLGIPKDEKGTDLTYLSLALFGKYPIDLGGFTLFPMLGVQGEILVNAAYDGNKIKNEDGLYSNNSQLWFKLGVGADINITESLYLRPTFLYGLRLPTASENDTIDMYKSAGAKDASAIGHGLDVRLAVGYRF